MNGLAVRILPYVLAFLSSLCIMILELVASRLVARHVGASLTRLDQRDRDHARRHLPGQRARRPTGRPGRPGQAVGPLYALGAFLTLGCLWMNAVVGLTPGLESLSWNAADSGGRDARLPRPGDGARDDRPGGRQDGGRAGATGGHRHRRRLLHGGGRLDRRDVPGRVHPDVPRADLDDRHDRGRGAGAAGGPADRQPRRPGDRPARRRPCSGCGSIAPVVRMVPARGIDPRLDPRSIPVALAGHALAVALAAAGAPAAPRWRGRRMPSPRPRRRTRRRRSGRRSRS